MIQIDSSLAIKKFRPEKAVFVISYDNTNHRPSGMVCGWSTTCSSDPDMIAVSLWKKGYTHKLIQETKEFVVAVPNKSLLKAIKVFGENHGDKLDKFKVSKVKTSSSKFIKPPLLSDATMNFECVLDKEIDSGDHILFLGKIVASYINEGKKVLVNMGRKDGKRVFKEFTIL
jgi:flavin reductase (DIM6/NTAB) family NADH-FMN oxidoreductase RutF